MQPRRTSGACDNGVFCDGADVCNEAAVCVPAVPSAGPCDVPVASVTTTPECFSYICNEALQQCLLIPLPDGTECDDGVFCNGGVGTCSSGACEPDNIDPCAGVDVNSLGATDIDINCAIPVCDNAANACVVGSRPVGSECGEGTFCGGDLECDAQGKCGVRVGFSPCPDFFYFSFDDECVIYSCNEDLRTCGVRFSSIWISRVQSLIRFSKNSFQIRPAWHFPQREHLPPLVSTFGAACCACHLHTFCDGRLP